MGKFKIKHTTHDEVPVEKELLTHVSTWIETVGDVVYRHYAIAPIVFLGFQVRRPIKRGRPRYELLSLTKKPDALDPATQYDELPREDIPSAVLKLLESVPAWEGLSNASAKPFNFGSGYSTASLGGGKSFNTGDLEETLKQWKALVKKLSSPPAAIKIIPYDSLYEHTKFTDHKVHVHKPVDKPVEKPAEIDIKIVEDKYCPPNTLLLVNPPYTKPKETLNVKFPPMQQLPKSETCKLTAEQIDAKQKMMKLLLGTKPANPIPFDFESSGSTPGVIPTFGTSPLAKIEIKKYIEKLAEIEAATFSGMGIPSSYIFNNDKKGGSGEDK